MKAVILVAGQGKRLRPLTDDRPKCLVKINAKPILQFQLECLNEFGIEECVVVVGFKGNEVYRRFGSKFGNMNLIYVFNHQFESTNNIYSLWSAKEHISDDIILIEGDVLFECSLLEDVRESAHSNLAVVDRFQSHMDGTVVLCEANIVTAMVLKEQQAQDFDYQNVFKTVNVYKFDQSTMCGYVIPELEAWITKGLTDQFYEATIAQLVAQRDFELGILRVGNGKWVEIDTIEDLHRAELQVKTWVN